MDLREAIKKRRSVRKFKNKTIPREEIAAIIESAIAAPSGKNLQPWHFTVVTGEKKDALVELLVKTTKKLIGQGVNTGSCLGSARAMDEAPVLILIYNTRGNPQKPPRGSARYRWSVDIQSIGAAIQNMLLEATARGIGSLWICDVFFADEEITAWLGRKDELVAAVALGYPDEEPQTTPRKPREAVTKWEEG